MGDRAEGMNGLAKGLAVIEAFGRERERLTIADAARAACLDRATARRCLLTLTEAGYASFDGKFFRLTPRVLKLGYAYLSAAPLPGRLQPFLEELSEATQESCSASILDGAEIVYVARAAQRRVMSIGLSVGSRLPAFCASMGRVLLAALPDEEARAIFDATERRAFTPKTLTGVDDLMAAVARVREDGFAVVDGELEIGLRSIAVPVRDAAGRTLAALNTSVQAARATPEELRAEFLPHLLKVQDALARVLV